MSDKKLVWLPKELAEQIEAMSPDAMVSDVIDTYFDKVKRDMADTLAALDDSVIQYKGLAARARTVFREATEEILEDSYKLWEEFDKGMPSLDKKIGQIKKSLSPLKEEIAEINTILKRIDLHQLDKLMTLLETLRFADNGTKAMLRFLMSNYEQEAQ